LPTMTAPAPARSSLVSLGAALQTTVQQATSRGRSPLIHLLLTFGIAGVFLVSIVDSSFVPLPIPGITDIMTIVLAARKANLILLVAAGTAGSFLGGLFSYKVGHAGGMAFLEKHVSPRILKPVCRWMEQHAILAVALPAVLPPPMPLSPFVLAAGALQMSRKKFLTAFTISRGIRHSAAAAIGVYYGPSCASGTHSCGSGAHQSSLLSGARSCSAPASPSGSFGRPHATCAIKTPPRRPVLPNLPTTQTEN